MSYNCYRRSSLLLKYMEMAPLQPIAAACRWLVGRLAAVTLAKGCRGRRGGDGEQLLKGRKTTKRSETYTGRERNGTLFSAF